MKNVRYCAYSAHARWGGNNLARAMSFERAAAAALIDICDRNGRQPLTKTKPIKQNKDE